MRTDARRTGAVVAAFTVKGAVALATATAMATATTLGAGCAGTLDDPGAFTTAASSTTPTAADAATMDADAATTAAAPACDAPAVVFATRCATAGCHGAHDRAAGLVLPTGAGDGADAGAAGADPRVLVGARAGGGAGLLVDPSDPAASTIYTKTTSPAPYGAPMPLGTTGLDAADRACVLGWIRALVPGADGALDAGQGGE